MDFEDLMLRVILFGLSAVTLNFLSPAESTSQRESAKAKLLVLSASGVTVFVFHVLNLWWYAGSIAAFFVAHLAWEAFRPDPPSAVSQDIDNELRRLRQARKKIEG